MIHYVPEYVEVEDIASYCKAVRATLKYWLDLHTDAEAWAWDWFRISSYDGLRTALEAARDTTTGQIIAKNRAIGWFEDIEPLILHTYAYTVPDCFEQCTTCGEIADNGSLHCSCCDDSEVPDSAALLAWMEDMNVSLKSVPYRVLAATILGPVFEGYRRAVVFLTEGIEDEVQDGLQKIDEAANVEEYLAAITWAAHVHHACGNLVKDYGAICGLTFDLFDDVQQNGLIPTFGDDDFDEFIANWRLPSKETWKNQYTEK